MNEFFVCPVCGGGDLEPDGTQNGANYETHSYCKDSAVFGSYAHSVHSALSVGRATSNKWFPNESRVATVAAEVKNDSRSRYIDINGNIFRPYTSKDSPLQTVHVFNKDRAPIVVETSQFEVGFTISASIITKGLSRYCVLHTKDTRFGETGRREVWSMHPRTEPGNEFWLPESGLAFHFLPGQVPVVPSEVVSWSCGPLLLAWCDLYAPKVIPKAQKAAKAAKAARVPTLTPPKV